MTSNSTSSITDVSEPSSHTSKNYVKKPELCNNLCSNRINDIDVDSHLTRDCNSRSNVFNQMNENYDLAQRSISPTNLNLDNPPLSSSRRPLSTDESDDGFQVVKNKKKQKQIMNVDPEEADDIHITRVIQDSPNLMVNKADQNPIHINNVNLNRLTSNSLKITNESTRFALTRYPFSPFILRFNSGKVTTNQIKEGLIDHCKKMHQFDIQIMNCRSSSNATLNNEYDILLYVKDAESFSFLLDQSHWPQLFANKNFSLVSSPPIPPQ